MLAHNIYDDLLTISHCLAYFEVGSMVVYDKGLKIEIGKQNIVGS